MQKFRTTIASLPDRDELVAEVLYDNVQWAEISQEKEDLVVQFYAHPRQGYWEFSLDEAVEALEKAKNKLISV